MFFLTHIFEMSRFYTSGKHRVQGIQNGNMEEYKWN